VNDFLTFTVIGLMQAAIFAIAASGLVVTYTTSGIFNFAHGAFGMIAAFTYWQVHVAWGVPTWPAFFLVVLVLAPLFGAAVERFIMRGIEGAPEVVKIVVTISLMVALIFLAFWIWPEDRARPIGALVEGTAFRVAGVTMTNQRLLIIGAAVVVAIALRFILRGTRLGIAMRAVVDDRSLLQLNGGRPGRTSMLSWAIGAALAAIAGILLAGEQAPSVIPLTLLVVNAYAAAVVGRLKSIPGAFLGAIILGLAIQWVGLAIPSDATLGPIALDDLPRAVPSIMLFVVIVLQPQVSLRAHSVTRPRSPMQVPSQRLAVIGGGVLVLAAAAVGSLIAPTDLKTVVVGFSFALITLSLVPLTGYAGQISLAQVTFTGIGAVVMANWGANGSPFWVAVSIAVCALVGAVVALPALRLQGIYLALATAAFAIFCTWMVFSQQDIMRGGTATVPRLSLGPLSVESDYGELLLLAIAFAAIGNLLVALRRSSWGRRLAAMKDSPVACATLGLNLTTTKVGVFALSAGIAGAAGALAGRTFVTDDFQLTASLPVTMLAVVGGIGSVGGALMGGLLLGAQGIATTVLAANAIGVFGFVSFSMTKVLSIMPGFMGLSLGRNPEGAASQIADNYRDFSRSGPAMAAGGFAAAALWFATRGGWVDKWSFFACMVVLAFAALPLLPSVFPPPGQSRSPRATAVGLWLVFVLVGTAAVPWDTLVSSAGYRLLLILMWSLLAAGVGAGALGDAGPRPLPARTSPDMIGVDEPMTRADALLAGRALGIEEAVLAPDARAGLPPGGDASDGDGRARAAAVAP
jgi:branched-subunit amino acid ABC-type transport system permease component